MPTKTTTRGALLMLAALGAGGCAHLGQEDLDAGLAGLRSELRGEIAQGDQATAARLNGRMDGVEARMAQLAMDLDRLEEDFGVTVQQMEMAMRFDVPVYFAFDAAELNPDARVVLARFGSVVSSYYPGALVTVEGFTDPSGSAAYNRRLGQRRADAVRTFLTADAGLSGDLVRAVSYGEDTRRLVAPEGKGPGAAGWQNRRVVMVIEHNGATPATLITDGGSS